MKILTLTGDTYSVTFTTSNDGPERMKLTDLADWYSTSVRTSINDRTNGDGAHRPAPSRRSAKVFSAQGIITSASQAFAEDYYETVNALVGRGGDIALRYEDQEAGSVRTMADVRVNGTIAPVPFAPGRAKFAIPLVSPDGRKFAENARTTQAFLNGVQPVGAGLVFPLFTRTAGTGAPLLDFGAQVPTGLASAANGGLADIYPVFQVSGGGLDQGFAIVDTFTGAAIRYSAPVGPSEVLVIDMTTKRVLGNDTNDLTAALTVSDNMYIGPGETHTYTFRALGNGTTGTPQLAVTVKDAWW